MAASPSDEAAACMFLPYHKYILFPYYNYAFLLPPLAVQRRAHHTQQGGGGSQPPAARDSPTNTPVCSFRDSKNKPGSDL